MKTNLIFAIVFLLASSISAKINLNNELSVSGAIFSPASSQIYHSKVSYRPEFNLPLFDSGNKYIDSKFVGNLYYNFYRNDKKDLTRSNAEFYRIWFRVSNEQSEIRVGRQKINFGPAILLRSLRWFDRLDPRDPQHSTPGTDAFLFRHYFMNNSNLWAWAILSDRHPKGNELIASPKNTLEYGGRFQYTFEYCEAAISLHTRELNIANEDQVIEYRAGLDSRWDSFIGYWIELSVGYFSNTMIIPEYEKNLTVGADYSIPWGNSIYLLAEHAIHSLSEDELFNSSRDTNITALNIDYPLSFFSSLKAIVFYNWETRKTSNYLLYNYSLDYIDLYFSINYNPETNLPDFDSISYDGASFQVKAVYNFNI